MTNDESPADVAATVAALPADSVPLTNMGAAPELSVGTTPSSPRRRATTLPASAAARSRRTAPKKTEAAREPIQESPELKPPIAMEAEAPIIELLPEAQGQEPDARRRGARDSRRRSAKSVPASQEATEFLPALSIDDQTVITEIGTVPAAESLKTEGPPAERSRWPRRAPRKQAAGQIFTEQIGGVTEPPFIEAQALALAASPAEAPIESTVVAPAEKTGRARRGGRSRRHAGEPISDVVASTNAVAESVLESPAVVEQPEDEKQRRALRGGRRRAEKPEQPEDVSRSGGRLVSRRGVVELVINGEVYPPVVFFGNVEGEKEARRVTSEVQRAASNGVHIHSTLMELTCPLPPDDVVYETFDSRIETLINADPKGFFIPRVVFVPAPGWRRQYPNEVNHYADGSTDDPSIASNNFWMEAENALTALIDHVSRTGYGERVIGYHLERGEWFHPVDGGYDRSFANREAFRAWLRAKYKNSEASLRAAWFDGSVQFFTADIPDLPAAPRPEVAFFEPRKERRWIDFLEYSSEVTADRLIGLARAVKAASKNRALVSVCYGYTFEFGHTFSGHLSLGRLLESPAIDIVAGPPSYRDREPGSAGSFPGPIDSLPLHGKLWLSEDDTKTYLAPVGESPDDFNPRIDSRLATEQVQKRAMGKALAHRTAIAWMDTWGEGWLDNDDIWRSIGTFTSRYRDLINSRKTWSPEVVVLIGEKSLLHVQKGDAFVRRLLRDQREIFQQSGASVGYYLQTDILAKTFPTDAKLYVFLTPYRLPADQRAAIKEKLLQGGKTVVWMYAPGLFDARGEPEEGAHELVGITLRQQSWNSEVGSRILDNRHAITTGIQNKHVGVRERLNPSFSVDDDSPGISVLAEYQQSGLPSIAVREMPGWRTVYCGEPTLSADLLRGLCRHAGVHLYTAAGDDYVFAGDGWVTVHTTRDGNRTIQLPPSLDLFSLDEMRLVAQNSSEYRAFMKGRTTYSFFVGSAEEMRKLGLPVGRAPARRRGRSEPVSLPTSEEAATLTIAPIGEGEARKILETGDNNDHHVREVAVPVDLDGQFAANDGGSGTEPDSETAEAEGSGEQGAESAAGEQRRRRRRGGRGRGRRHRPGGGGAETGTAPPVG